MKCKQKVRRPNWYFPQFCSESLKSFQLQKQFTDRKQYFMVTELASGRQEVACSLLWVLYLHISYVHLHLKGDFFYGSDAKQEVQLHFTNHHRWKGRKSFSWTRKQPIHPAKPFLPIKMHSRVTLIANSNVYLQLFIFKTKKSDLNTKREKDGD